MPTADQMFSWLGIVSGSPDVLLVVALAIIVAWIAHLMMRP